MAEPRKRATPRKQAAPRPANEPEPQMGNPNEPRPQTEEEENEIATMDSVFGTREIEVDPVVDPVPPQGQQPGFDEMVVVRMNTTLEDFTFGNPNMHVKLEEGKRYRLPYGIAHYLDGLGYVWH